MTAAVAQAPPTTAVPVHTADDIRMARRWAGFYRSHGYNPLPMRPDDKRPFRKYAEYWEKPYPVELFESFETGSLQVMTGRRWGLVVVDLDGREAIEHWEAAVGKGARTWTTHSGGDGRHLWFSVPADGPPIRSGRIWGVWEPEANDGKGDWKKHVAIEILADRKLVVAPPSIHPKTGKRYRFLGGRSPREVPRPAPLPLRILDAPRIGAPRRRPIFASAFFKSGRPFVPSEGRWDRNAVLDAVPDKAGYAARCGLRLATGPNDSGWCSCHAIGREDRNPSASFHAEGGHYWEHEAGAVSFFDMLVLLGAFDDWRDAVAGLGHAFGVAPSP